MLDLDQLRAAVKSEGGVSRRLFLAYGAALSSLPLLSRATWAQARPTFSSDPFTLGVASGDPDASSVVLWTRLAPQPLEPYGGMPAEAVKVAWEIADDEGMKKVVAKGTVVAVPQLGHAVHVEARGLQPDRWYWYRFRAGEAESRIGRTRTLPATDVMPERLKFAFASCQHYETGLFTAYDHMLKQELDLVFHLGDYIYEGAGRDGQIRKHSGSVEIKSLHDYRARHNQYRTDESLRAMHEQCPWFVTWDDHEFDNNCAGDISEEQDVDPVDFLERRANAYQAYYESMPLRRGALPRGPHMQLFRKASFGRLAELLVLDTRQYRTNQPNNDRRSPVNDEAFAKSGSLLGVRQRNWLYSSLLESGGTWNVFAQQVMMGMAGIAREGEALGYSMDQWPGYAYERMKLMEFLADRRVANPVVLTGDIHSHWCNDLRVDDRQMEQPVVATEFVGTSISSGGNGADQVRGHEKLLADNPFVHFQNSQRGYVQCTVTPGEWRSDYFVVDQVSQPGGDVTTRASFVVEAGRPGAKPA